jgi:hypothetical protein
MDLEAAARSLQGTYRPEFGPAQLEISNIAITLDAKQLDSKQVVYVDVRCGSELFRTTAQARLFDPLSSGNAPLAFDTDRGIVTVPTPIQPSHCLQFSVRRCQIFGDSDVCSVQVPIASIPLVREAKTRYYCAGPFVFGLLPVNFGFEPDPNEIRGMPSSPIPVTDGVVLRNFDRNAAPTAVRHGQPARKTDNIRPAFAPAASSEITTHDLAVTPSEAVAAAAGTSAPIATDRAVPVSPDPGASSTASHRAPPATTNTATTPTSVSRNNEPAGNFVVMPAPLGLPEAPPVVAPEVGVADDDYGPLELYRNEEQLKPLHYRGCVPVHDPPVIPVGYVRSSRLRALLEPTASTSGSRPIKGLGSLFGAVSSAVSGAVSEMSNVVDLEMMRGHFPNIRSPLVHTYSPHVLNGHGTPIEGKLYVTTVEVAFHGPLLQFHVPFVAMPYLRRTTAFGRDCIQLFCPNHEAYQLQDLDGVIARFGSALGVREHSKFYDAYCLLVDLWRHAHSLPSAR